MSRKKIDVLGSFVSKIEGMLQVATWAKLDKYLRICDDIDRVAYKHLLEAEKWVTEIYRNEYKDVYDVWKFLAEEKWTRYRDWDLLKSMREATLLMEGLAIFGKALRSSLRPNLMKPSKWKGLTNDKRNKPKKVRKDSSIQSKKRQGDETST